MASTTIGKTNRRSYDRSRRPEFRFHFTFESFGVKIRVTSNQEEAIERVREIVGLILFDESREIETTVVDHHFLLVRNPSGQDSLYKNGENVFSRLRRERLIDSIDTQLLLTVGESARDLVFVHSGVVAINDRALLIPAPSFHGKSSLIAALVKRGALYYSDEYAVLDKEGFVHPFARPISIREGADAVTQVSYPVDAFGGTAGSVRARVGMVLKTKYDRNARWNPKRLSRANGILELVKNAVPIRRDPARCLKVFEYVARTAHFVRSDRPDAEQCADSIMHFFRQSCG